jgi:RimJ/RimL family protein N-acetyltransferase
MNLHASPIETTRLILIPTTLEHLEVELNSPEQLSVMLGAVVPATWPPGVYDRDAMQFFHAKLTEGGDAAVGWYGWYAVQKAAENRPVTLVACGGYFGPPADGVAEIGYSVAPEFRCRGFATEIVKALLNRAFATRGVNRVVAETAADNIASRRALVKCGFRVSGAGREPGHVHYECNACKGSAH